MMAASPPRHPAACWRRATTTCAGRCPTPGSLSRALGRAPPAPSQCRCGACMPTLARPAVEPPYSCAADLMLRSSVPPCFVADCCPQPLTFPASPPPSPQLRPSCNSTLPGWVPYTPDRGGRSLTSLQIGLLASGASLVAACSTLIAVLVLRHREQRRWQTLKGGDAELAAVRRGWGGTWPRLAGRLPTGGRTRRGSGGQARLAWCCPRCTTLPCPGCIISALSRHFPACSASSSTPPQRDGKDPLADIIAATAARRRSAHSALAEEVLKDCRIDQVCACVC